MTKVDGLIGVSYDSENKILTLGLDDEILLKAAKSGGSIGLPWVKIIDTALSTHDEKILDIHALELVNISTFKRRQQQDDVKSAVKEIFSGEFKGAIEDFLHMMRDKYKDKDNAINEPDKDSVPKKACKGEAVMEKERE